MAKNNSGEEKGKFSVEGKAFSYILFIGLVEGEYLYRESRMLDGQASSGPQNCLNAPINFEIT